MPTSTGRKPLQQETPPPVVKDDASAAPGTPLMPHERDELPGRMTAAEPDPVIVQAKRDLDAGMVDTDMRVTPGLDAERREELNPMPASPEGQASPGRAENAEATARTAHTARKKPR